MTIKADALIIGAGIIGSAVARELSKYNISVALLDKNTDVCEGVTKANSGIVHAGFDDKPGTTKNYFCIKGNALFPKLEQELHISYRPLPTLVLAFQEDEMETLHTLYDRGRSYGIKDIRILSSNEAYKKETSLNEGVYAALYCGSSGIVSPYEYGIALVENAVQNGVQLYLSHTVQEIKHSENKFQVLAQDLDNRIIEFSAKILINAAGLYADSISRMLGVDDYTIHPRKGQYLVFDKGSANNLSHILFQCPSKMGKGVLVTPTYHGNLMIGPNAEDHNEKDNVDTDIETLTQIYKTASKSIKELPHRPIRTYAGNRPISSNGDFIIREDKVKGFYELAGIASPGLTSSYAIAEHVSNKISNTYSLDKKSKWNPKRSAIIACNLDKKFLPMKEIMSLADLEKGSENRIVCRCEQVREQEINEALSRNIPIQSTDAIKRRTRAGMGACQGTFCKPRVKELIAGHNSCEISEISTHGNKAESQKANLKDLNIKLKKLE